MPSIPRKEPATHNGERRRNGCDDHGSPAESGRDQEHDSEDRAQHLAYPERQTKQRLSTHDARRLSFESHGVLHEFAASVATSGTALPGQEQQQRPEDEDRAGAERHRDRQDKQPGEHDVEADPPADRRDPACHADAHDRRGDSVRRADRDAQLRRAAAVSAAKPCTGSNTVIRRPSVRMIRHPP
jgi:hypothetical protein